MERGKGAPKVVPFVVESSPLSPLIAYEKKRRRRNRRRRGEQEKERESRKREEYLLTKTKEAGS